MRTLILIAVLAFAPTAAAAGAPDERAAAQAMADAAERLLAADTATDEHYDPSASFESRRCRRELYRIPPRRQGDIRALFLSEELRHSAEPLRDALLRFRNEIAAAVTHDRALISGRAAWRRLAKAFGALPAGGDPCEDVAAWRRTGYDRATIRRARAEYRSVYAAWGRGFERKTAAAADRMRELGIPEDDARVFEGAAR